MGLNREESFQKQTAIPHSFKKTAIQFKTDKANDLETDEKLKVDFYEIGIAMQGGFTLNYGTETLSYKIDRCHTEFEDNYKFPDNMPTEDEKVWSILVTTGAQPSFKCQVNGVEVINLLFTDDICGFNDWRDYWTEDITDVGFFSEQTLFAGYSSGNRL